jgi:alanine racemase
MRNVHLHSISTHLPSADERPEFTCAELARFDELVRRLRPKLARKTKVHALATAGALLFPNSAYDLVRAGLSLYGISPVAKFQHLFRPALSLKSRVVLLREIPQGTTISYGSTFTARRAMRVATIAVGYADGYTRALSNSGAMVLIRGRRCAVLGRITMDLTVVDVSDVNHVSVGDEVVLIGRDADEEISATELAKRAGTIPWEILTGIGSRVPRVYL